jgi:hypothetical protein
MFWYSGTIMVHDNFIVARAPEQHIGAVRRGARKYKPSFRNPSPIRSFADPEAFSQNGFCRRKSESYVLSRCITRYNPM